ncbi:MAG: hypothetical protein HXK24_06645, partial [Lancefieldella parvula]|nr:hypothetical protein [Lancefieldella parvula]
AWHTSDALERTGSRGLKWSSLAGKKWQDMRGTWHEHAYVDDAETHNNTTVMLDFDWKDI